MAAPTPFRYRSADEDSARWLRLRPREGDIVVSTRSKSGTTWVQAICCFLVFGRAELPAPLAELSPWLDWLVVPIDEVVAGLDAQQHRRVIKTHTPLDGLPLDPRVTYVVVARHPLDAAVSLYHQGGNLDRARLAELTGQPSPAAAPRPALHDWLVDWIDAAPDPRDELDSLPGVFWHLGDAWARREEPNVVLVHYADLSADLDGAMRRLAARLGVEVAAEVWPQLVEAARFPAMQARAAALVPDPAGVLKDPNQFFRKGRSGAGRAVLSPAELARYEAHASGLAPPALLGWLHRPL